MSLTLLLEIKSRTHIILKHRSLRNDRSMTYKSAWPKWAETNLGKIHHKRLIFAMHFKVVPDFSISIQMFLLRIS